MSSAFDRIDGLDRFPAILGFARRGNLHRNVGQVLLNTIANFISEPARITGSGFSDFDLAFLACCIGGGRDGVGAVVMGLSQHDLEQALRRTSVGHLGLIPKAHQVAAIQKVEQILRDAQR